MSVTLDSKIEFMQLCKLFERIAKTNGSKKFEELQKFIRECRIHAHKMRTQYPDADISLFPIFRLILPSLERDRGPYGMKSKSLAQLYTRVFCLGKKSDNAKKLMNYKKPTDLGYKSDDLAERIFWMMRSRLLEDSSSMTIQNVNKFLNNIANCHECSKNKDEHFIYLIRKISAIELKWLTRLLLKDLRLGITHKKVFQALHKDAQELFNVTSNLRRVCERFSDSTNEDANFQISIELFSHIKPMLLERFKIEQIGKFFVNNEQLCVQTKYDGERLQVHLKDGRFKYFTRQGYDITHNTSYGPDSESGGFLTSNIALLLNKDCYSIILDGELMGWHKTKKCFGSKALNYDVKKLTEKSCYQPCFVIYDIIYYNNEILINKPYSERLDYLKKAFTEKEGILMKCNTKIVSNREQLIEIFNTCLDNDDEGIVIKKPDTLYKPNIRENSGCYKIKAEYSDGLVQDLDLIILGGYYGQGRCSGIISSFLVGVANSPTNKNGMPSEFFAVVSVRSGLNDNELQTIQKIFRPNWKSSKPVGVFAPRLQQPDVWISPKHSLILEIRATEIIKSSSYPTGYTLRFPRVLKLRLDKPWYNTCSVTEFTELVKSKYTAVQKLTKRKVTADDINDDVEEVVPKIRKTKFRKMVYEPFVSGQNYEYTRVSRLFNGKEICVINGDEEMNKNDISSILQEHMAKEVQNPGENTFCVIVGDSKTLKAQNVISSKKYDVVSLSWLKRATKPENISKIQEFYHWELFSMQNSTKLRMDQLYDHYSDSYTDAANEESLKRSLAKIDETANEYADFTIAEMKKIDKILFDNHVSPFGVFRGIVGYFQNHLDIEQYSFTFMSGVKSTDLNASVNYIFINDFVSADIIDRYKRQVEDVNSTRSIQIINSKWIFDCYTQQSLLSIENYII